MRVLWRLTWRLWHHLTLCDVTAGDVGWRHRGARGDRQWRLYVAHVVQVFPRHQALLLPPAGLSPRTVSRLLPRLSVRLPRIPGESALLRCDTLRWCNYVEALREYLNAHNHALMLELFDFESRGMHRVKKYSRSWQPYLHSNKVFKSSTRE